jgi:predicted glutamine amidotransferase
MCGICYAMNFKGQPARDMVKQQFNKQRSRGFNGFGFVATAGTPKLCRRTDEKDIMRELKKTDAPEILFHHRYPTSTANVRNACHPFKIKGIKSKHWYYVVHNGIIQNDDELKEKHDKLSLKYKSVQEDERFNDSEALAHEIMLYLEGEQEALEARGSVAFICQEFDEHSRPLNLHYCRNGGNPLRIKYHKGSSIQIASELNGKEIEQDVHYTYNYATDSFSEKPLDIKRWAVATTQSSYYHGTEYYPGEYDDGYQGKLWKDERYHSEFMYEAEYNFNYNKNENYNEGFESAMEYEVTWEDLVTSTKEVANAEADILKLLTEWQDLTNVDEKNVVYNKIKEEVTSRDFYRGFTDGTQCALRSYVDTMDWSDDDECEIPCHLVKELKIL